MERLQPRYLEAFAPALCAVFGISLSVLWRHVANRRASRTALSMISLPQVALVYVLAALLAASLSKDIYLIHRAHTDSVLTDFSSPALSRYLRAHRHGTRYEVASANVNDIIGLVARDDLPVLVLNSVDGSLTRSAQLQAQVAAAHVRYYFIAPHTCHTGRHCPANQVWAFAHSIPVQGQPGLRRFTVGEPTTPG